MDKTLREKLIKHLGKARYCALVKQPHPDESETALLEWCGSRAAHDPVKNEAAYIGGVAIALLQRCGSRPKAADWRAYADAYPGVEAVAEDAERRERMIAERKKSKGQDKKAKK